MLTKKIHNPKLSEHHAMPWNLCWQLRVVIDQLIFIIILWDERVIAVISFLCMTVTSWTPNSIFIMSYKNFTLSVCYLCLRWLLFIKPLALFKVLVEIQRKLATNSTNPSWFLPAEFKTTNKTNDILSGTSDQKPQICSKLWINTDFFFIVLKSSSAQMLPQMIFMWMDGIASETKSDITWKKVLIFGYLSTLNSKWKKKCFKMVLKFQIRNVWLKTIKLSTLVRLPENVWINFR